MSKSSTAIISATLLVLAATTSHADPTVSYRVADASPQNTVVARCVDAVKRYHDRGARLHLKHRARYFEQHGERVLNLDGWVWKDGSRVKVSHQCVQPVGGTRLALNVAFDSDTRVAER